MHNSARGETQRKTSKVESGSIAMNSGFHLKLAAKLSSVWGPLLALANYQHFHNHVRPHQALDWKTPNEYLQQSKDCPIQSHM